MHHRTIATLIGSCAALSLASSAGAQLIVGGEPNPNYGGLQLWLDAGEGITTPGGQVSYWDDRSAANHDAQQTNTAAQPTHVLSNPVFANRPTLSFEATDVLATVNPASALGITGTADRTMFIVFRKSEAGNAEFLGYGTHANGSVFDSAVLGTELAGHYYGGGNDTTGGGPTYVAGDLAVMTHEYNFDEAAATPTGLVSIFEKTLTTTGTVSSSDSKALALSTGDSAVLIGMGAYDLGAFSGDIAEILIYDEVLSSADRAAVEDYLFTKYTTPVPEPGSAALLAAGLAALAGRRRHRVTA